MSTKDTSCPTRSETNPKINKNIGVALVISLSTIRAYFTPANHLISNPQISSQLSMASLIDSEIITKVDDNGDDGPKRSKKKGKKNTQEGALEVSTYFTPDLCKIS